MVLASFSQRLSAAAHRELAQANPLPAVALEELISAVLAAGGARVLDVGCGAGAAALELATRAPLDVVGLDLNPDFLAQARQRGAGRLLQGRVRWLQVDLNAVQPDAPFDGLWCMGASQAFGGPRATLAQAGAWLAPGGWMVLGDLEWAGAPSQDFLNALGMTADDLWSEAETPAVWAAQGWEAVCRRVASREALQAYEAAVEAGRLAFAQAIAHEDPEGADRVRAQVTGWRQLMAAHGQEWQFAAQLLRKVGP